MKINFTLIIVFFASSFIYSQTSNQLYDSTLAKKLGADKYGMKDYFFVILKSGENKTKNEKFIDSCFEGHMQNIRRLAKSKQLVLAGPFGKNEKDFRGLFILNASTIEDATKLLETDPAIKSKLLQAEIFPWYGSAALPQYLEVHDKIWKENP